MSGTELIERATAYATYAIRCDRDACAENDPTVYRTAVANYSQAMLLYTQAQDLEIDPDVRAIMRKKVAAFHARANVLRHWLVAYDRELAGPQHQTSIHSHPNLSVPETHAHLIDTTLARKQSLFAGTQRPVRHSSRSSSFHTPSAPYLPSTPSAPSAPTIPHASPLPPPLPSPITSPQPKPLNGTWDPGAVEDELEKELEQSMHTPCPDHSSILKRSQSKATDTEKKPTYTTALELLRTIRVGGEKGLTRQPLPHHPKVGWNDVAGLTMAKEVLKEAVLLPEELPRLFGVHRQPWKTILLYGPSGVGKSLLTSAAAQEGGYTLVPVNLSDVTAADGGEGEEKMRNLFQEARTLGRVLLYFRDVELVFGAGTCTGASTGSGAGWEGKARVRQWLLDELRRMWHCEQVAKGNEVVFVGSTRAPWQLDEAFLGRMHKRLYIGLPGAEARTQLLDGALRSVKHNVTLQEAEDIARECEGYSAADLEVLVRDAVMEPVRVVREAQFFRKVQDTSGEVEGECYEACDRVSKGAVQIGYSNVPGEVQAGGVSCLDFEMALQDSRPSVTRETVERHEDFTRRAGQSGA